MIAAEEHREFSLVERRFRELCYLTTDSRYGAQVARSALCAALGVLAKRNRDVAAVLHRMTKGLEPLAQVGVPDGIGAHVHAPSRCAQVHRDAD